MLRTELLEGHLLRREHRPPLLDAPPHPAPSPADGRPRVPAGRERDPFRDRLRATGKHRDGARPDRRSPAIFRAERLHARVPALVGPDPVGVARRPFRCRGEPRRLRESDLASVRNPTQSPRRPVEQTFLIRVNPAERGERAEARCRTNRTVIPLISRTARPKLSRRWPNGQAAGAGGTITRFRKQAGQSRTSALRLRSRAHLGRPGSIPLPDRDSPAGETQRGDNHDGCGFSRRRALSTARGGTTSTTGSSRRPRPSRGSRLPWRIPATRPPWARCSRRSSSA